jgi:hypothetical protein
MPTVGLPITLTADQTFNNGGVLYRLAGPVNLNGHALTLQAGAGGTAIAADISGAGSVTFNGGAFFVSGHNTYTGPTVIAGVVDVRGSIAGPVTLQNGSLSGSGSVGDVTVTGGQIAGALSQTPSTLTTGSLTLSDLTTVRLNLTASGSDKIAVIGSVHLAGTLELPPGAGFSPIAGQQFTIIDNDGTDPVVGTFAAVPDFPGAVGSTSTNATEGAIVMRRQFGNFGFRISYKGGDGNDVTLTTVALPGFAVGAGAGGLPLVNVYDGSGALVRSFLAYESTFRGGVHVVTADVTGDNVPDTITAPGLGGGPLIRIWDGQTGAMVKQFLAYDGAFRGGVNIAAANISHFPGEGPADIITGAGPGGGPHVKVFDATTLNTVSSFFAFDPAFRGGVTVAGTDSVRFIGGGGIGSGGGNPGQVIAGAGPGGVPLVRVFDGAGTPTGATFLAYDASFRGGVNVAWDGFFINTAPGAGSPPLVKPFSIGGAVAQQFLAYDARFLATWDGGGADNHWTTAANWVGDVAPNPGDDLDFPQGPPQLTNVNDFPAGTAFRSMAIGPNYVMTGNSVALAAGLTCSGFGPQIYFSLTLTGDQSFSGSFSDSGSVDVNGHALNLTGDNRTMSGPINGSGSLTFSPVLAPLL